MGMRWVMRVANWRRLRASRSSTASRVIFGPAHVGVGVVGPAIFVAEVVAAGAVGARDANIDFLVVVGPARNVDGDVTHDDEKALLASHARHAFDGIVALGRRAEQDFVGAVAAGEAKGPRPVSCHRPEAG